MEPPVDHDGELGECQHKCGVFACFYAPAASQENGVGGRPAQYGGGGGGDGKVSGARGSRADPASTPPMSRKGPAPDTPGSPSRAHVVTGCAELPDQGSSDEGDLSFDSAPRVFGADDGATAGKFPLAGIIAMGLQQLQHRGQESCGIVTCDKDGEFDSLKGMGLVASVCKETELKAMGGHMGLGHVRYSTAGGKGAIECQPFVAHTLHGQVALAHNGQVVNADELMALIMQHGVGLSSMSDSEVIMQMLCAPAPPPSSEHIHGADWQARIRAFMSLAATSYALAFMTSKALSVDPAPLRTPPLRTP